MATLLLAPGVSLAAGGDVVLVSGSDATWVVDDANAGIGPSLSLPGAAQLVCLNDSSPTGCPAEAVRYGWGGSGWSADLSAFPGAWWIWAPGVTGATSPADSDTYTFTKTINVPGTPTAGSVSIAADDSAQVVVNGTNVGSSNSPNSLSAFDITSLLVSGDNTVVVTASNAVICGSACPYSQNPGAVAVGLSITYTPTGSPVPTDPPTSTVVSQAAQSGLPMLGLAVLVVALLVSGAAFALKPGRRVRRDR